MSLLFTCVSHDLVSVLKLCLLPTEDHSAGGEALQPQGASGDTAS